MDPVIAASSMALDDDGTRTFTWEDGFRVELAPEPPDRRGRRLVRIWVEETLRTRALANLNDLRDLELLWKHSQPPDQTFTWLDRLTAVANALPRQDTSEAARVLETIQLSTVDPERVEWLWKPYLPLGRTVSLEGNPGVGKSTVVLKLAAHLTAGKPFPTVLEGVPPQAPFPPRTVCLLSSEDDAADTIRPRLEVNGGEASRLYQIKGWTHPDGSRGIVTLQDLRLLDVALERYEPALLVVDPFQAFFGRGVDMNHANETRPILEAVADLAKQYACTVLYVRHLAKAHKEQAIYAAMGSIDISAHVRSALLVGVDPDDRTRRILTQHKVSNAPESQAMAFTLTNVEREMFRADGRSVLVEAPRLDWDGRSTLTATDLLAPKPPEEGEDGNALEDAQTFLTDLLAEGPRLYTEVLAAMKQAGVAMRTLRRAKPLVHVKARRRAHAGGPQRDDPYEWYLPRANGHGGQPDSEE